ncbi:DNA topoisomerase 2-like [Oryza glaberrima]|uniref:DNA topoisomerase 2-like n=1 Tax=Oryza glaberrima TaxID=4538 RepID=UPI00224BFAF0|nr:DNA topoisomerase 2-like [Oryza glaberrima]
MNRQPPRRSSARIAAARGGSGDTLRERILLRPDGYIGSPEKRTQTFWVNDGYAMVPREVTYCPGLHRIFDEVLVHAASNKRRDPSMDTLSVEVDVVERRVSVFYNGRGAVPVELLDEKRGVYAPEMFFGHLHDDDEEDDRNKMTNDGGGAYGVKLANLFSTEFVVETADGCRMKKYKQVFSENMGKKSVPHITDCNQGENWTTITFKPDLARFNMTYLEEDHVTLMWKRVVDMAGILGDSVQVEWDGMRLRINSFNDYVRLHVNSPVSDRSGLGLPRVYEKLNDWCEVCLSLSDDGHFQQVSFVNGFETLKGGTHVDYVTNQITTRVMNILNEYYKKSIFNVDDVKRHLWVFLNVFIDNPTFDSQTKEMLTTPPGRFGSKLELPDSFSEIALSGGLLRRLFGCSGPPDAKIVSFKY